MISYDNSKIMKCPKHNFWAIQVPELNIINVDISIFTDILNLTYVKIDIVEMLNYTINDLIKFIDTDFYTKQWYILSSIKND